MRAPGTNASQGLGYRICYNEQAENRAEFDFHDTVVDQLAEGDKVAARFISRGTHTGTLLGIAAMHKQLEWTGTAIDRIVGGKIVENWVNWDMAGNAARAGGVVLASGGLSVPGV